MMEKLNQVEHLARVNARKWCSVTTVDTRDILAIAEALRAMEDNLRIKQNHINLRDTYIEELEQRAEAAEANVLSMDKQMSHLEQSGIAERDRRVAAEAKLAELEKQEPVAWRYRTTDIKGNPNKYWAFSEDESLLGLYQPLFTRPAPAVSLAELVPDGWKLVPVEPSWEMISAAIKSHEGDAFLPVSLYKSMLAAAPEVL